MFKHRTSQDRSADSEQTEPKSTDRHPAFAERIDERHGMVTEQITARGIADPQVIRALRTVPRHVFMPKACQPQAYQDKPLPIGYEQTISQPYIVAFMTELLKLTAQSTVLEIGTGSGYQTAVCAEIVKLVYSIEIVTSLAEGAAKRLGRLGYRNIHSRTGDGYEGWAEVAPFDAVIATAAAGRIPHPLIAQLNVGGRMVIPRQDPDGSQTLVLVTKETDGQIVKRNILPVRFVPMTGDIERPEKEQ